MWQQLGKTVAKYAPLLGGALGGPGGAVLGQLVAGAFGVEATPQAIEQAITQDPQAALKLQEIQTRHKERLEELALERHKADLAAETARHGESQATIRHEAQHGTDYVKETRPKIARLSFYAGAGYVILSEAARMIAKLNDADLPGTDTTLLATLFGPVGFYMTMRSVDAFTAKGKS
jgi:hypothetical protein